MKTKDIQELYKIKLHSMDTILHQISLMDQVENEQELSEIIHSLLQAIGNYTGADRVYVFDWETDQKDSLSNTFEWCADGVIPEIDNLQAIPVSLMPSWMKRFENKETIVIHDLEATKCSEPEEYELLKTQEICSLIAVPIYANHQMNGFIGVDNPDLSQNEISITLLSDVGGHLGCVRENLKSTVQLKKAFDEATKRTEIISAIATLYVTIVYANIKERTYELLEGYDFVRKILGQKGKIDDVMEQLPTAFAGLEERERYRKFLEFDTLTERLRNTNSVSIEFMGANGKWRQSRFIVKSRDAHGNAVDVLYVARDITEEKSRELMYQKRLKASMEDAHRANLSKTAFLQRMSHDIRTPINGICGMLDMADHYADDMDKQRECRTKIKEASNLLLELVNEVLDMSKLESDEVVLEESPFNLSSISREVLVVIGQIATEQNIRIVWEKKEVIHWNLIGSPGYVKRILMNILTNAVKYNRENGCIYISCMEIASEQTGMVTMEFVCRDTGIGMTEAFQKRLFEPFAQEHAGSRTKFSGTGLGMSITKKLIEKMGGTITFESELGEGTTFVFRIPFQTDPDTEKREEQKAATERSIKGLKILLAEDNALNMEIAEFMLQNEGACVCKAWNGQQAAEIFENSRPHEFDVILMDIMMPVMNGYEAAERIRSLDREDAKVVPIIAMTANAFTEDRLRAKKAGMDEHIAKPIDVKLLVKVICKLVGNDFKGSCNEKEKVE